MNRPATIIVYVNAAHFIVHYAMLIYPAALIVLGPEMGLPYGKLLAYATPGFIAFGAGSILTGWLGDRWSRRHMMVIFFIGIGLALAATGLARTPLELGAALLAVGAVASIYHPVGTAMIVANARGLGRELGINGVWGNVGVASSALATGLLAQFFGWRAAFVVPGAAAVAAGFAFALAVKHAPPAPRAQGAGAARVPSDIMWRVLASLFVTVIGSSTAFNAVTVVLPDLFKERLALWTASPALLGSITSMVYLCGAAAQYAIGGLIDRYGLRRVFLTQCFLLAPALYVASLVSYGALVVASIVVTVALFGQVTINDAMVGKYTADHWRSRAYSVRYFLGFVTAGVSVALVAALHERGGFALVLQSLAALSASVMLGGLIFPSERPARAGLARGVGD